ncbi:MAG: hypothetical protein ACK6D2_16170, partial [Planctomycetota bacterium]
PGSRRRSAEFAGGDSDPGILERIDRKPAAATAELAALAAAAARFLLAERAGAASAAPAGKAGRDDTPRWAASVRGQRQWRTAP